MERKRTLTFIFVTACFLAVCAPMFAHHGNAEFDVNSPVTLKGTVTEFAYLNPHVQIFFDVKDDSGKVVHWGCLTAAPGKLSRAGWTKDLLKPGDQITISLSPAKNGRPVGSLRKLVLADGKEMSTEETPY